MSGKRACLCCGHKTVDGNGDYHICEVCFWEDDPVAYKDPDFAGGANDVSLNQARDNYKEFGASERRFLKNVRAPKPSELQ